MNLYLLGRVNSCHGFHERIVIHASGFYALTLSAEEGDNAANKLTAECPAPRTVVLGTAVRMLLGILVVTGFTGLTRLRLKPCLEVKPCRACEQQRGDSTLRIAL
jgi:hypothetical protein